MTETLRSGVFDGIPEDCGKEIEKGTFNPISWCYDCRLKCRLYQVRKNQLFTTPTKQLLFELPSSSPPISSDALTLQAVIEIVYTTLSQTVGNL